jgi:DNA-directed RNA polymerase subunit RPC12/RpoP
MARHTPTPWSVETPMDEEFAIVQSGLEAYEWQFIAVCPVGTPDEGGFPRQNAKLNAAFIVKACNGHDALVKALNDLHVWCETEGCGDQAEIIKDTFKAVGINEYRCTECNGAGEWDEGPLPARHSAQIDPEYRQVVCPECKGKGTIALSSKDRQSEVQS